LFRSFFITAGGDFGGFSLFYSFFIALLFSLTITSYVANFSDVFKDAKPFRRMIGWAIFILTWQLLIVGLFLPLDFVYQTAIVFLISMVFIDMVPAYIFGELSRTKTLVTSSFIFVLLAIIVSSARWGL
jgi:exosortase/archaeosortase